jgi:serine/threonine protein kinase
MGDVYEAPDVKLDRDVAINVLPEAFVFDPERLARFQGGAKTLAPLNHQHIVPYARRCCIFRQTQKKGGP